MAHKCLCCGKVCKTERGLSKHRKSSTECEAAHLNLLGTGFCQPINTTIGTNSDNNNNFNGHIPSNSPDPPLRRRSNRVRAARTDECAAACEIRTTEVEDVEVTLDEFPAADCDDTEPEDVNSEASDQDLRDDLTDTGSEHSDSSAEGRNPPPKTDLLEDFLEHCRSPPGNFHAERDSSTIKSVRLLEQLRKAKAPLYAYKDILEWHLREIGHLPGQEFTLKDAKDYSTYETLMKNLSKRYNCDALKPEIKKVRLPNSKSVVNIPVRNAKDVIVSLLTDPRIGDDDYLFFDDDPLAEPPENPIHLEDLNTGDAYLATYEEMIEEKGEVLLPVPIYIDGAVTGQFSDLPLTPVKLALGIHKRETRDKDYAWRELGWIPQVRKQKARGRKLFKESGHLEARDMHMMAGEGEWAQVEDPDAREGIDKDEDEEDAVPAQDFHSMLRVILESFVELQRTGFVWDLVYKGKLYKNIKFKIFVPFVKCDTEEADLLCGKFKIRTRTVKQICRYCHCPTLKADDPRIQHKKKTPEQIQKLVDKGDIAGLKAISQQCIDNAWYEVVFHKANNQGIHGACPSEMLHAILLGIFKYVRESFFDHMGKTSELAEDINGLAKEYGVQLSHQSERDLPKANFSKGIQKGKLTAKEYRGVLLVMAALVHSSKGRDLLKKRKRMGGENGLTDWSMLIELLLEWEAYLNLKKMLKSDVKRLKTKMKYLMYLLRNVAKRYEGMGLKIMKFHALVHLVEDMLLYGVPSEFDTGSNESHHKASKYAAKLTQRNEATFVLQAAQRLTELLI